MPTILVYENTSELYNISNSKSSFTVSNTFRHIFTCLCCFFYYIFFIFLVVPLRITISSFPKLFLSGLEKIY